MNIVPTISNYLSKMSEIYAKEKYIGSVYLLLVLKARTPII